MCHAYLILLFQTAFLQLFFSMHLRIARQLRQYLPRLFCGLTALVVLVIYWMFPLTRENSTRLQRTENDRTLKFVGLDPCIAWHGKVTSFGFQTIFYSF